MVLGLHSNKECVRKVFTTDARALFCELRKAIFSFLLWKPGYITK